MERDRLNFFSPFEGLDAGHENQLTRALLVVLRLSPLAHAAWLKLVAADRDLHKLLPARFDTQRRALRHADEADEPAELISVFLAPEEPPSGGGVIAASDRRQVLDAVVDYGGELIVAVENKIAEADDLQARQLNFTGARVRIREGQDAVVVLWRDLLEVLTALRERDLVAGAEAAVLDDFLTYVEDNFGALGPFRTLGLARGNPFRQGRRLRRLIGEAAGREAVVDPWGACVSTPAGDVIGANAYLTVESDGSAVDLSLYPADTLGQARAFYQRPGAISGLRKLLADGWEAGPNFHFGHMQRGFCWTCNHRDLEEYVALWTQRISKEREIPRAEWDAYWAWLQAEEIASPHNRPEFDRHFTHTHRQKASPRPGLWMRRRWPLAEAEALDAQDSFRAVVREALDAALLAFGEPRLGDSPPSR